MAFYNWNPGGNINAGDSDIELAESVNANWFRGRLRLLDIGLEPITTKVPSTHINGAHVWAVLLFFAKTKKGNNLRNVRHVQ